MKPVVNTGGELAPHELHIICVNEAKTCVLLTPPRLLYGMKLLGSTLQKWWQKQG